MIKSQVIEWLKGRTVAIGESVSYGWFNFWVTEKDEQIDLETLDFEKMASKTRDFTVVDSIHYLQQNVLASIEADQNDCNLLQCAIVSKSYSPTIRRIFMSLDSDVEGNDSGWYIGVINDLLDANDPGNLYRVSVYELSINDNRLLPFWLLPKGYQVHFDYKEAYIKAPINAYTGRRSSRRSVEQPSASWSNCGTIQK